MWVPYSTFLKGTTAECIYECSHVFVRVHISVCVVACAQLCTREGVYVCALRHACESVCVCIHQCVCLCVCVHMLECVLVCVCVSSMYHILRHCCIVKPPKQPWERFHCGLCEVQVQRWRLSFEDLLPCEQKNVSLYPKATTAQDKPPSPTQGSGGLQPSAPLQISVTLLNVHSEP